MSDVKDVEEAARLVATAKAHGFVTTLHCAAPCTADGVAYTYEEIERIAPDVLTAVNGDPTPLDDETIKKLVQSGKYWFDCLSNGSEPQLIKIARWAAEAVRRIGCCSARTCRPCPASRRWVSGSRWPLLRRTPISRPRRFSRWPAGNVARCYGLDHGVIADGMTADFLMTSTGSIMPDMLGTLGFGRVPSVAGTFINGAPALAKCKNMAPPKKKPVYTKL